MNRVAYFDALKLLLIYLVVLGHFLVERSTSDYGGFHNFIASRIYSFHMPAFMALSGFFSAKLLTRKGDVLKRARQLLLPSLTLFILFFIVGDNSHNMWFLKSLFICYVLCDFYFRLERLCIKRQSSRYSFRIAGFLLFAALSPLLTKVPYLVSYKVDFMFPFFCFGILLHQIPAIFEKKGLVWVYMLLFVGILFFWRMKYIWYFSRPSWWFVSWTDALINIKSCVVRYVSGMIGVLFLFSIFSRLNRLQWGQTLFEKVGPWGRYSMQIYILQTIFVESVFLVRLDLPSNPILGTYLWAPLYALAVVLVCILLTWLIDRSKVISTFLFGNKWGTRTLG